MRRRQVVQWLRHSRLSVTVMLACAGAVVVAAMAARHEMPRIIGRGAPSALAVEPSAVSGSAFRLGKSRGPTADAMARLAPAVAPVPLGRSANEEAVGPWYSWLDGDCIAELRLAEAYPLRYNTADGLPPYDADLLSDEFIYGWMSYIPLRLELENVIWGDCPYDGVLTYQVRQISGYERSTPPPDNWEEYYAPWVFRPESLGSQPSGLGVMWEIERPPAPPGLPYRLEPADAYVSSLAEGLTVGGLVYVQVSMHDWYEYVDGIAISGGRQLPIVDLLAEVHEGLRLMGRE